MVKKLAGILAAGLMSCILLFGCSSSSGDTKKPEAERMEPDDYGIIGLGMEEPEVRLEDGVFLEGENVGGLTISEVTAKLREKALAIDIAMSEPQADPVTWEVKPGKEGKRLNIDKTLQALLNAKPQENVKVVVEKVSPTKSVKTVKANIVEIAKYSTPLLDRREARVNNIDIAAEVLDYHIIQPGEEFSYNDTLGRRTEEKGYEKAPIIINTKEGPKKSMGVGGGICQLSSTIYNAALKCGMKITERHEHSKDVGYVPDGKDATVAYGSSDLKFVNTRKYPVMIRTSLGKKKLTVKFIENRNNIG